MIVLLADAELELLPDVMLQELEIQDILRRLGKDNILLDNHSMKKYISKYFPGNLRRMGFPDIAYMFWRMNEESVLRDVMNINYAIHTKWNIIIEREDLLGIEPSYLAFKERVEEILSRPRKKSSALEYLKSKGKIENTVVLHPRGEECLPISGDMNYVIGGFPEGDFISEFIDIRKLRLHRDELTVPAVLEILHFRLFSTVVHP